MFSLSVLVLMTSLVLGISKPIDEIEIKNEDKAEIEEVVKAGIETVKGSESDNLKEAVPGNGNDEESSNSRNTELEQKSGSDQKKIVKFSKKSGETESKENIKTGEELETKGSENKPVTANEKAENITNEKSERSSNVSKKQVRSVTDESITSDVENKLSLEGSIKENSEEQRLSLTSNVTKSGSVGVTSDDEKGSSKTGNTELENNKNQSTVKIKEKLIKKQVLTRSASNNEDNETDRKGNTDILVETALKDDSLTNLKKSEAQTKKIGKTGEAIDITLQDVSVTKQYNQPANSRSEEHDSLKDVLSQSAEKKSSVSSDTVTANVTIDEKDKIASLESQFNDNSNNKLIDKLTSQKGLQKRSQNYPLRNGEMVSITNENTSLKETDKTINDLKRGLSDNEDSSLERSKPTVLVDAPTRRNNRDESLRVDELKMTQDKSARYYPLLEFSNEDDRSDTQESEISRSAKPQKIQLGYHKHIPDVPFTAKRRPLDFPSNNYNGGEGIPQLQNKLLQSYHPLALRPLPQNFFISPPLRVFRSPTQEIKKITADETILPNSPGFPPGFTLPNKHTFPHSGYNPQIIPPIETLNQNILAQNVHSPVVTQNSPMQKFKTPTLLQNPYNLVPKSGNFDHFEDYLNTDDDNPKIEDYKSIDQNAYIYHSKTLNAKAREGPLPTNLQEKLTRASNHPEMLQIQGSQRILPNHP